MRAIGSEEDRVALGELVPVGVEDEVQPPGGDGQHLLDPRPKTKFGPTRPVGELFLVLRDSGRPEIGDLCPPIGLFQCFTNGGTRLFRSA
jgi:hypothetical protein